MKQRIALIVLCLSSLAFADAPEIGGSQNTFEKEISAVVRNKKYYKAGKLELSVSGGLLPYDQLFTQYMLGGRLTWHIRDHYGWEIVDFQKLFSSTSSFTTSLAGNSSMNIYNLQGVKSNMYIGSAFLFSPFYGKGRFFGKTIFLDIYAALGLGMANTTTMTYSFGSAESAAASAWDPSINYGLGFKFFIGNAFSVFFDMRNYMSYSVDYSRRSWHSNFALTTGLSFFFPGFG